MSTVVMDYKEWVCSLGEIRSLPCAIFLMSCISFFLFTKLLPDEKYTALRSTDRTYEGYKMSLISEVQFGPRNATVRWVFHPKEII